MAFRRRPSWGDTLVIAFCASTGAQVSTIHPNQIRSLGSKCRRTICNLGRARKNLVRTGPKALSGRKIGGRHACHPGAGLDHIDNHRSDQDKFYQSGLFSPVWKCPIQSFRNGDQIHQCSLASIDEQMFAPECRGGGLVHRHFRPCVSKSRGPSSQPTPN